MEFTYDGVSLPMLLVNREIFRVQVIRGGYWHSLETEEEYGKFFNDADVVE
jgi:hypothetical protein